MSDHETASPDSQSLCQLVFDGLTLNVPNLQRIKTKRWCGFFSAGRKRFAYLNHRKRQARVEIWALGDPERLRSFGDLEVRPRQSRGAWEEYASRFFLDSTLQVDVAVKMLSRISFPVS